MSIPGRSLDLGHDTSYRTPRHPGAAGGGLVQEEEEEKALQMGGALIGLHVALVPKPVGDDGEIGGWPVGLLEVVCLYIKFRDPRQACGHAKARRNAVRIESLRGFLSFAAVLCLFQHSLSNHCR